MDRPSPTQPASGEDKTKKLEAQVQELERQLRSKDALAKKDKAVYEQKIELQDLQIKELKQREDNLNRMHNTMLSALKQEGTSRNDFPKELEIASAMYKKDVKETKDRYADKLQSLELRVRELDSAKTETETALKQLQTKYTISEHDWQTRIEAAIGKTKEAERRLQELDSAQKKQREAAEADVQTRLSSKTAEIERMKAEHEKELDKVKEKCEHELKDIRYIFEQEKLSLEAQLAKAQNELRLVQSVPNSPSRTLNSIQNGYLEEIKELNAQLDTFKRQSEEEVQKLRRQLEDALEKAETAEKELGKMRGAIKDLHACKQRLTQAKELFDCNLELRVELKKLRKELGAMKGYVAKLEEGEKRMRDTIVQKDADLDDAKQTAKRKLSVERKKLRDEYDQERLQILKEINSKSERIEELSRQLRQSHVPANKGRNNTSAMAMTSRECGNEPRRIAAEELQRQHVFYRIGSAKEQTVNGALSGVDGVSKVGLKQLKEYPRIMHKTRCESMVDSASRMECRHCKRLLQTECFLDHIFGGTPCSGSGADSNPEEEKGENMPRKMEESLPAKEMARKAEKAEQERDKMLLELDHARTELRTAKEKCREAEDAKNEAEMSLKAEIKFLISKLMRTQGGKSVLADRAGGNTQRQLRSISTNCARENVPANVVRSTIDYEKPKLTKRCTSRPRVDTARTATRAVMQLSPNTTLRNHMVVTTQARGQGEKMTSRGATAVDISYSDVTEGTHTQADDMVIIESRAMPLPVPGPRKSIPRRLREVN